MIFIRYASLRTMDISNGEGVGIALFVQGCHFHCYNCFNQETWEFNGGKEWTEEIEQKFISFADKPYIKRISLLGGEPLAAENLDALIHLLNQIRILFGKNKKIWLFSGYIWDKIFPHVLRIDLAQEEIKRQEVVKLCDVLVDGQFVDELKDLTLKWRGSSNQRVIDVQQSLEKNEVILWANS